MSEPKQLYVACYEGRYQDGSEACAKVFDSKGAALAWINKIAEGFEHWNCSFELFKLGERLAIEKQVVEEPQPAKVTTKYV